jgi:hypothetical protein
MLDNPISFATGDPLDFSTARSIADQKAREKATEPMLLAWFDKKSGKFAPDQICCDAINPVTGTLKHVEDISRWTSITRNMFSFTGMEPDVLTIDE